MRLQVLSAAGFGSNHVYSCVQRSPHKQFAGEHTDLQSFFLTQVPASLTPLIPRRGASWTSPPCTAHGPPPPRQLLSSPPQRHAGVLHHGVCSSAVRSHGPSTRPLPVWVLHSFRAFIFGPVLLPQTFQNVGYQRRKANGEERRKKNCQKASPGAQVKVLEL